MRKVLISRKSQLFPETLQGKERAEMIIDTLYCLASNRSTKHGVYKVYAANDVDELLTHYEDDL